MKKLLAFFLLFFLSAGLLAVSAQSTGENIESFHSNINIEKSGKINVKETIIYNFGDNERHGIYRYIPYIKTNSAGKQFKLTISGVSVTDENGQPYNYTSSFSGTDLSLKIGDAERTITGIHTYVIDYTVSGALTYFSDHDELNWNTTGNGWMVPIQSAETTVSLPAFPGQSLVKMACYTGVYGSKEKNCETSLAGTTADFVTTQPLNASEGLTIVYGFPKKIVAVLEPVPYTPFFSTSLGKILATLGLILFTVAWFIWVIALPIYIIFKWWRHGRDPKPNVGVTSAWFDPPKSVDGKRFLTPGEVGTLGDESADLKDISATVVDLARRGYLIIQEKQKGDFYLIRRNPSKRDSGGILLPFEKILLDNFFDGEDTLRLKDAQLSSAVNQVKNALYADVVAEKLFPQDPQSVRTKYYILATVAIFTGNIGLAVVAFVFGRVMPVKTQFGSDCKNIAHSLKNFLVSQERQLEFQAKNQMMFERLLPYAIAFGVEKIWAKRFQSIDIKPPSWYQAYNTGTFNSVIFVSILSSSMQSFATAATPTTSSSGFSSGFSGGFSGGGGGGGGGGSW